MTKGDFTRWMYHGGRPNWIARAMNRLGAAVASMGVTSNIMVTLETTGRSSGRTISQPMVVAVINGQRYLVSMLGENVNWVKNVRAAGGKAALRSGSREEIQLEEVPTNSARSNLEGLPAASTGSTTPYTRG